MTRYAVMAGSWWVTAIFGTEGLGVTRTKEDASSWPTYEQALAAAQAVAERTHSFVAVHSIDEPAYSGK